MQDHARKRVQKQEKTLRPPRKLPRRNDADAFFNSVRSVDIVDWLVASDSEIEKLQQMTAKVGDACEQALKQCSSNHKKAYLRLADHFWCDVIATLAQALTEITKAVDQSTVAKLRERTWQIVHDERSKSKGNAPCQRKASRKTTSRIDKDEAGGLDRTVSEKIVKELTATLIAGSGELTLEKLNSVIVRLRVLAILLCPDPYAHKAVWEYCVVPLLTPAEEKVVRAENYGTQFFDMFKQEWVWNT